MTRRIYPKPPITEAIVELRFPKTITRDSLLDAVNTALSDSFRGERQERELVEFQASVQPGALATSARRAPHLCLLRSEDNLRQVACADGALSVHVLAPYPGWEAFSELVGEVVAAASPLLASSGIHQIAVRYIDRIVFPPDPGLSFGDLLAGMPHKPAAMPERMTAFHYMTQTVDAEDGTVASLVLASSPSEPSGLPVVLYDLTVLRQGEPLCPAQGDGWMKIMETLHDRQRAIFEDSITDRLRESFQ